MLIGTRYRRSVVPVPESPLASGLLVLKESTTNKKLTKGGKYIQKGRYRGLPMYSLTLEERATCWSECQNWTVCYGDNMPFAKRYKPGIELEAAITADVHRLAETYPNGFAVRLHVLGDFYSERYVDLWAMLLFQVRTLHLFGYTHWPPEHPIGKAVSWLHLAWPDRVAFRRSDRTDQSDPLPGAFTLPLQVTDAIPGSVVCPEQTGQTASCTTCGLCMDQRTNVSFINHAKVVLPVLPKSA